MRDKTRKALYSLGQIAFRNARKMIGASAVDHMGVKIAIGHHLSWLVTYHIRNGDYECAEVAGIRALLEPDDIVMELGAGIGFISLQCAKAIGGDRVFAYEANPALEPHIRQNYDLNDLHPKLEMCILGEKDGEADFFIEKDMWDSSMIRGKPDARKVSVPVRSLNDAIRRNRPTFLIMDIEGGEYDIMKMIDFQTIRKVAFETHEAIIGEEKVKFVEQKLRDSGFVVNKDLSVGQQLVATRS